MIEMSAQAAQNDSAGRYRTDDGAPEATSVNIAFSGNPEQQTDTAGSNPRGNLADSLALEAIHAADSAQTYEASVLHQRDETIAWRNVAAEEVFGRESILVEPQSSFTVHTKQPNENLVFQGFVLLLAAIYIVLMYRNSDDVKLLFKRATPDTRTKNQLLDDSGSGLSQFLNITAFIGLLLVGVTAVRLCAPLIPAQFIYAHPITAVIIFSLTASLAAMAVMLFQTAILKVTGAVTLSQKFISQILLFKRIYFALATIICAPIVLLCALCSDGREASILTYLLIFAAGIVLLSWVKDSIVLFKTKNISNLHWFLYLCTVEVLPISFIWLLAIR